MHRIFKSHALVLIPVSAQLCTGIIKGAVMYSHNTKKIVSRIARYTYGIEMNVVLLKENMKIIGLRGRKYSYTHFIHL